MFAQYISRDDSVDKLLSSIKKIDPAVTNIKNLVQLKNQDHDPRQINSDSFLDGGIFLLWCLKYDRIEILEHFLEGHMIQFWRFA